MYNGLLHLHNLMRWVILLLLVINIINLLSSPTKTLGPKDKRLGLFLVISAHITLLVGLYQYFFGKMGFRLIQESGMAQVMKVPALRFWAVEHTTGMLIAIILITVANSVLKKNISDVIKRRKAGFLFLVALIIILLVVPWPFRADIGRPWFPGMKG